MTTRERRIAEALDILRQLGMPNEQLNDRTAICLLALLNLSPRKQWRQAESPLIGIRAILDFAREKLGVNYAENTRGFIPEFNCRIGIRHGISQSREIFRKFLAVVAWETEVWCASDPTHLIHFNGERFLGPYGAP